MRADKIVQFVCFDTTLGSEQFIKRWEQYSRSVNSDLDVTVQQSEKMECLGTLPNIVALPANYSSFLLKKEDRPVLPRWK